MQIKQHVKQVGEAGERLARAMQNRLVREQDRKKNLFRLLNNFSYERVLERGFVLVRDAKARPVTSAGVLKPGMALTLSFHDGEAAAVAVGVAMFKIAESAAKAAGLTTEGAAQIKREILGIA